MDLRRDALAAAAEFVLAAERVALDEPGLVATVGELGVPRGAGNVIPGRVERHARHPPPGRRRARARDRRAAGARRRRSASGAAIAVDVVADLRPRRDALHARAGRARSPTPWRATGVPVRELPSGAGHDAVTMAGVTDIAMLFVRCAGGISHNPDESVDRGRRGAGDRGRDAVRVLDAMIVRGGHGGHARRRRARRRRHRRRRDRRGRARARRRARDRRDRPARLPRRPGPARALQRARPHALGRARDRQRRAGRAAASRRSSTCR